MEHKIIKGFENYILYENGDIYNNKTNKKVNKKLEGTNKYKITLYNNKNYCFTLIRLIYETFFDVKLTNSDIIRFKDENSNNKFHYKNLEKLNRTDMFKNINNEILDKNKEWKFIKDYEEYKISNHGDIYSIKSNKMLKPTKNLENYYCIKFSIIKNK